MDNYVTINYFIKVKKGDKSKQIVGFTAGSFDLCHAGHVLMFKECKKVCDYLVVALQSDPTLDRPYKNKPVMSLGERKIILAGIKYIDKVVVYNTEADLVNLIKKTKPDVRIMGADWKGKEYTGRELVKLLGHKIYFNSRNHSYTTSELRKRIYEAER